MEMILYKYTAKITKVVDGDTVHALVDLGFSTYRELIVRLAGINTPELNSPHSEVRSLALAAKQRLTVLVLDRTVFFDSKKYDRYGRSIADLFITENNKLISVSNVLVAEGLAVEVKY